MKETDDFKQDTEFGKWLGQKRNDAKLSLKDAAKKTGMNESRLQSLELGYAERGIKKSEAEMLCQLYRLDLQDFLKRALGDDKGEG